jgi:hypothetical protein
LFDQTGPCIHDHDLAHFIFIFAVDFFTEASASLASMEAMPLTSNVLDRDHGCKVRSDQTKDHIIGMCCFSVKLPVPGLEIYFSPTSKTLQVE